jgi:predicted transcriptional regulator
VKKVLTREREIFHPKAFLSMKKNVCLGLKTRTNVILVLENGKCNARTIADSTSLQYKTVIHHLNLLRTEKVVVHKNDKRPFLWELTGSGQKSLTDSVESH